MFQRRTLHTSETFYLNLQTSVAESGGRLDWLRLPALMHLAADLPLVPALVVKANMSTCESKDAQTPELTAASVASGVVAVTRQEEVIRGGQVFWRRPGEACPGPDGEGLMGLSWLHGSSGDEGERRAGRWCEQGSERGLVHSLPRGGMGRCGTSGCFGRSVSSNWGDAEEDEVFWSRRGWEEGCGWTVWSALGR